MSKIGLMLCLLLAGGVMLVPIGGDFVHAAKMKVRDLALRSRLIDFVDCVVTPDHAIVCTSDAAGMPLPAVLRQMQDTEARAVAEEKLRLKAETDVRDLALEVERLKAQVNRARLAADGSGFFPPFNGDVRPTGLTGTPAASEHTSPSGVDVVNAAAESQPDRQEDATPPFSLTPPPEGD